MIVHLRVILVALIVIAGTIDDAIAGSTFSPRASDSLSAGQHGATYLDLIRLVAPGIAVNGESYSGAGPIEVRHILGLEQEAVSIAPGGHLGLTALPLRSGGADRLALLIDFGETEFTLGFAVLALFDLTGEPILLDAADIASDRWTAFMDPPSLAIADGDDLLVTRSTHFNSQQAYATATMILARNDRYELVDTISLLSDRACGFERDQSLAVEQGQGTPFADIVAIVTERTTLTAEDCGGGAIPEPATRTIAVTYRWDPLTERYAPDSDAFNLLALENEARF